MQPPMDRTDRFCIIGAGSSGLTAAKNLREQGLACDVLEREDDVGGNWYFGKPHSSVYRSVHLISSKPMTEYTDYPMPAEYPDYPGHAQVWEYLRSYARHFGLYEHIEFNTSVADVRPVNENQADSPWDVELNDGSVRRYRGVVVANGHNWDPRWPDIPNKFRGVSLHSGEYKTPDVLRDKRVLVIGAGNSGCDLAVESAQNAAVTLHSTRRGYHYYPKYFLGRPADQVGEGMLRWRLPLWLRRLSGGLLVKLVMGRPQDYGLPAPDHRLFETHPIVNSQMLYYVGHGEIQPMPDVQELREQSAVFVDGREEAIDVVIFATGFKISFPFIDVRHLNWNGRRPDLYLNVFHPRYDTLFVIGLIQPDSGQFGLADCQARAMARFLAARQKHQSRADWFRQEKERSLPELSRGIHYVNSPRHLLEVEHFSYRKRLEKLAQQLAS